MPSQPPEIYYFDTTHQHMQWRMNETLYHLLSHVNKDFDSITILCIGSDRLIGDSFGPLTGHMLSACKMPGIRLLGTLSQPVHALSIKEAIARIDTDHSLVIAVDSSLGQPENIGFVSMGYDTIRPGSGLGKRLPEIGDISITGIVASGNTPFLNLQNASLGLVYGMAEKTYTAIRYALVKLAQPSEKLFANRP